MDGLPPLAKKPKFNWQDAVPGGEEDGLWIEELEELYIEPCDEEVYLFKAVNRTIVESNPSPVDKTRSSMLPKTRRSHPGSRIAGGSATHAAKLSMKSAARCASY